MHICPSSCCQQHSGPPSMILVPIAGGGHKYPDTQDKAEIPSPKYVRIRSFCSLVSILALMHRMELRCSCKNGNTSGNLPTGIQAEGAVRI